jgi:hypothetical protein
LLQVGLLGEKRLKVTVPVGFTPPETCAVSWIWVPTGPPFEAVVTIVGDALPMTTLSAPHALCAGMLLLSPP